MDIHVCELVPSWDSDDSQAKINEFNDEHLIWSTADEIYGIDNNKPRKMPTGEVDDVCYHSNEENAGVLLNRLGVIRLN